MSPSGQVDAGVDAKLTTSLEELSQLANYTVLQQPNGLVTVYLGGQIPLVIGSHVHPIQGDFSASQTGILDAEGRDVTALFTQGKLGGLLSAKNTALPSRYQRGTLVRGVAR